MKNYPTEKEVPNRDQRKRLRRVIFEENKTEGNRIRKEKRLARKNAYVS
jgi:hypothetical protein